MQSVQRCIWHASRTPGRLGWRNLPQQNLATRLYHTPTPCASSRRKCFGALYGQYNTLLGQQQRMYGTRQPFDTYRLVKELETHGYTRRQAEIITEALSKLLMQRQVNVERMMRERMCC
jgi:hypothetical protein